MWRSGAEWPGRLETVPVVSVARARACQPIQDSGPPGSERKRTGCDRIPVGAARMNLASSVTTAPQGGDLPMAACIRSVGDNP